MADISSILLFSVLAVLALGLIRLSNGQHYKSQLISHKISQLKQRVEELEELLHAVEPLTESLAIPQLINSEIIELLNAVHKLDKDDPSVANHLNDAHARQEELSNATRARELYRIMKSDAHIARAQCLISETGRRIQTYHQLNKIDHATRKVLLAELRWAHVMVSTLSLVAQGHKSIARGDRNRAIAYYRTAHHKLITSAVDDERRPRLGKELEDIITGNRRIISPDLMPETDYNPTQGSSDVEPNTAVSG